VLADDVGQQGGAWDTKALGVLANLFGDCGWWLDGDVLPELAVLKGQDRCVPLCLE